MSQPLLKLLDYLQKAITDLDHAIKKRNLRKTEFAFEKLTDFTKENFGDFERHMHFLKLFLRKRDFEWIRSNFDNIKEVDFPNIKSKIYSLVETEKLPRKTTAPLSKNIFIVHGRDHKPMKELKTMLKEFGLKPIILHEQPSGSRTIVEKLEKYSDVGYAFVILTPDDRGCSKSVIRKTSEEVSHSYAQNQDLNKAVRSLLAERMKALEHRSRQNVILEFGYFIGKLGRDRVCCLYKGDVELPSDMHGIVYIPFKESVNEVKEKIIKELKAAGYEMKI
jgi:predicted nucleotide-binding protein